jgi:hypothetical protein
MVGYPIYNNGDNFDDAYLSDVIVENGKYFGIGFVFAIVTTPSVAFAVEPSVGQDKFLEYVPTAARNTVHGLINIAGCGTAGKHFGEVINQAVKKSGEKLATVNFLTALGIGACLLLVGYCAGKFCLLIPLIVL